MSAVIKEKSYFKSSKPQFSQTLILKRFSGVFLKALADKLLYKIIQISNMVLVDSRVITKVIGDKMVLTNLDDQTGILIVFLCFSLVLG